MNNLIFRRQFVLSNKEVNIDKTWQKKKLARIKRDFYLDSHPDLPIEQFANERFELVLCGYMIDPFNPEKSSLDILKDMASMGEFDKMLAQSDTISGRYAIIYNDEHSVKIFNDAEAFREVYYYNSGAITACGSTPTLLAKCFNVPRDEDKDLVDFFTKSRNVDPECKWVGTRTVYKDVLHLLPNHYLDLLAGKTYRFWPVRAGKEISLPDAVATIVNILKGTSMAATKRFQVHQGLTGGWDSQVLLSASRENLDKIYFFFNLGYIMDKDSFFSRDYSFAKAISDHFGIKVDFIPMSNEPVDTEFEKIYYGNNILARPKLLKTFYDVYTKKIDHTITVTGTSGNEILRLMSTINRKASGGKKLAGIFGYPDQPYVVDSLTEWSADAMPAKEMNYRITDLFYWEQFIGNWGNLSGSEQDIVRDELRPFNNRLLISNYISVKDKYRYRDYPQVHAEIMRALWPELLRFERDTYNYRMKKILRSLGIEQLTDKLYQRSKQLF